jgi:hypothetical protein
MGVANVPPFSLCCLYVVAGDGVPIDRRQMDKNKTDKTTETVTGLRRGEIPPVNRLLPLRLVHQSYMMQVKA